MSPSEDTTEGETVPGKQSSKHGGQRRNSKAPISKQEETEALGRSLTLLDSIIQFLTRATGQAMVPLKSLLTTIPNKNISFDNVCTLLHFGVLQVDPTVAGTNQSTNATNLSNFKVEWDKGKECSTQFTIGFPNPSEERLSGSTKAAAKRRRAALKRRMKKAATQGSDAHPVEVAEPQEEEKTSSPAKDWTLPEEEDPEHEEEPVLERDKEAWAALKTMLGLAPSKDPDYDATLPSCILPKQISYAGTHTAQNARYDKQGMWKANLDPRIIASVKRTLYEHQSIAIESALRNIPTLVCTGTGSGKSLCFMIPVLNAALKGERSMLLFPTKALAQDQVIKLQAWLQEHDLHHDIRAATLDGDTPHSQRVDICLSCNVILTNPDTLHAAILPNWKHLYGPLLSNLRYVVLDEAHMYTGVFGAHVSMILARLYRLVCLKGTRICFLSCSATLAHPETHFRLLCCIPKNQHVNIVKEDASPRAAKHFWVWNPPILDMNGKSTGRVKRRRKKLSAADKAKLNGSTTTTINQSAKNPYEKDVTPINLSAKPEAALESKTQVQHRRHSADETALLLALAVSRGVRCIAFCKTRCLVEWVYERTLSALKRNPKTADLCSRVESYRGGYTKAERRIIEERLFNNELLGVVGTSALELGVDIGGVDLTLHCGFPSSHENLIQQSGRAGRGANASTSLAICVCFNSPMDQHLWRHPSSLLSRGFSAPLSMPIYPGLVQGHLLCAGQEFPLAGSLNASAIQSVEAVPSEFLSDQDLFGSRLVYEEALLTLLSEGSMTEEKVPLASQAGDATIHKIHPSMKNPWTQVSIRSIEPVSYQIVDTSHPLQGGRTDGIHDESAILDTIPYSRVFYHAFPGAIITHRSRRYKISCMTRPPAFGKGFRGSISLGAFAKPCNVRYATRPLSNLKITVVKQMERVEIRSQNKEPIKEKASASEPIPDVSQVYSHAVTDESFGSFAGCGVVTVKRNVHGYKKLSMVTREEISRSELSLPDMEFDSFAIWLDCDAGLLSPQLGEMSFGHGVHALAHAMVAVAPLFVPCTVSDVYCDHNVYNPTRVTLFDARAGGSGICAQLWKAVFIPKGIVEAAVGLLEDCPSCAGDWNYDGGCPACLQAGECLKFNDYLSKSSGLVIGRHLLKRLKQTREYIVNAKLIENKQEAECIHGDSEKVRRTTNASDVTSPRRKKRERALRNAKDLVSARDRLVVVGRPSWPMDRSDGPRQEKTDL